MHLVSILPATAVDTLYTYKCPELLSVGTYVRISFGRQDVLGVVWEQKTATDLPLSKIKKITEIYDVPPMGDDMCHYIDKVAYWTMSLKGLVLKMVCPSYTLLEKPKRPLQYLCTNITDNNAIDLSNDQDRAAKTLYSKIDQNYSCTLLDGVTGSGKTEVYFEAVAKCLQERKQSLIMMPEIALTSGFIERFEKRFGIRPAMWHSQMTPKQRMTVWKGVANGQTKAVIGARSSLFLPYPNLGLIVVDEEHDPSYKQEDKVIYNARDMAVMRGAMLAHPIILASATPSMETLVNVNTKRYSVVELPDRYGGAHKPDMHLIDMREDKPDKGEFISPTLHHAIAETISNNEQALLFLNRRGYAPLTLCRSCGARLECPQCTSWLVEHKKSNRTFCHHCDYGGRSPSKCPSCDAEDSLVPIGPGVERIAEEIEIKYPNARTMILSSDTTEDGLKLQEKLNVIKRGEVNIVIGTQMTAKGHHFPKLTCVGVVDADIGMKGGDLRAGERTWQLLHQVAGRAGREVLANGRRGQVFLQTYAPESNVMQSLVSHDRDAFAKIELENRRLAGMPPFTRLAAIILSSKHEKTVDALGRQLVQRAPRSNDFTVMGPAIPPFAMLRGRHRRRLLVRTAKKINLQKTIAEWLAQVNIPPKARLSVDIDPISFL